MRVRIASAGTGKTTSLVLRYLELIGSGVPPRRIAGVTFTRAAAAELRQRIHGAVADLLAHGDYLDSVKLAPRQQPAFAEAERELAGATITTIHGFMGKALGLAAPSLGLDPAFTTLAEWEARALFEEEVSSLLLLAQHRDHPRHEDARLLGWQAGHHLEALFEKRSLCEEFLEDGDARSRSLVRLYRTAYGSYRRRLGSALTAPGELERQAPRLLSIPAAASRLCSRYRVVLVDEFQDVNPLQGSFFEALEAAGPTVEVVGDPKQSIYGFRNADVEVFRRARERGEELEPLTLSYRHSPVVNRFLNRLGSRLAADGLGFGAADAPATRSGGGEGGRVEIHWVTGAEPLARLRRSEADVLAARLESLHEDMGIPYREMAVMARSHQGLTVVERALNRLGVPSLLQQGRGYYQRLEIRDLYNALRAAVDPRGVPFLALLRGPFGGLNPVTISRVMNAADPAAELADAAPAVDQRFGRIRSLVRLAPIEALKGLIREPLLEAGSVLTALDHQQRENVDALLFALSQRPPQDLEVLLDRLEVLARRSELGDVPQSGEGVSLLTVHAAKGLEWRVAALYDLSRGKRPGRDPLRVNPLNGQVSLPGTPGYAEAGRVLDEREDAEGYRLLYVAASRPRDVLLLTGSVRRDRVQGQARALELLGLGPSGREWDRPELLVARHGTGKEPVTAKQTAATRTAAATEKLPTEELPTEKLPTEELLTAEWTASVFPANPFPPLLGPSKLHEWRGEAKPDGRARPEVEGEPLAPGSLTEGELPGRSAAVGTLVHYAISQAWRSDDARHLRNLRAQEVMFPYDEGEQEEILAEVASLLANYEAMLGADLPELAHREVDEAELPMALPHGATVFQGVVDRLYLVEGTWYLDDYKTDRSIDPENYLLQLAVYVEAVRRARGVEPVVRLVYLRHGRVIALESERLRGALEELQTTGADTLSDER